MTDIHNFLQQNGFNNLPDHFILDNRIHRWSADSKPEKDEWYIGAEGISAKGNRWVWLKAASWSLFKFNPVEYKSWDKSHEDYHDFEMASSKAKNDAKLQEERDKMGGAYRAQGIWNMSSQVSSHPYLITKNIQAYGIKEYKGMLVIPFGTPICGLQFIAVDGKKQTLSGSSLKGNSFCLKGTSEVIGIAEGYATAATIYETLGITTYVTFGDGNLLAVAKNVREENPKASIVIFGDNDPAGILCANKAAATVHGTVLLPPTAGNDWNDEGPEVLKDLYDPYGTAFFTEINKRFAILHGQKDPQVMRFSNQDENGFKIVTPLSFKAEMEGTKHPFLKAPADDWLKSLYARRYSRIIFDPKHTPGDCYNLWQGFAVKGTPGEEKISLFKEHVFKVICRYDINLDIYLWKWMARIIQRPWDQVNRTSLVLMGDQGSGKSIFVEIFGHLFGQHFLKVTDSQKMFSRFGASQVQGKILILVDEASWGGNRTQVGLLKNMITSPTLSSEKKGLDVSVMNNYANFIFCSNEEDPIVVDRSDRRFVVLQISEEKIGDKAYFRDMMAQMENGGYEQLMYKLQNLSIEGFWAQEKPATESSFYLKFQSATSIEKFCYAILDEDSLGGEALSNLCGTKLPRRFIHDAYIEYCKNISEHIVHEIHFWRHFRKIMKTKICYVCKGNNKVRSEWIPTLHKARDHFESYFKSRGLVWEKNELQE